MPVVDVFAETLRALDAGRGVAIAAVVGAREVTFDLAAVRYISSAGVRAWCELLARLPGTAKRFRHCSVAFASQAAMVPLVLGDGHVISLEAPYYCEPCGRDENRLLEIGAIAHDGARLLAPRLTCSACGGATDLDDLPDRYFAFLASDSRAKRAIENDSGCPGSLVMYEVCLRSHFAWIASR